MLIPKSLMLFFVITFVWVGAYFSYLWLRFITIIEDMLKPSSLSCDTLYYFIDDIHHLNKGSADRLLDSLSSPGHF